MEDWRVGDSGYAVVFLSRSAVGFAMEMRVLLFGYY